MGIIADALKKAGEQSELSGPVADVPTFGGLFGEGTERPRVSGPQRAKMILQSMPRLDERVVSVHASDGVLAEQYRALRTQLLNQNQQNEHRILAVTSSLPQEGKSVTTVNLGFVMSEVSHLRVLMLDGDLRRGKLANMLNLRNDIGLANVIHGQTGPDEAIQPTAAPNLYFLGGGNTRQANATEVLSSARARSTFEALRKRFHYVIVDTPPINTVADVGIIGQMCHGVLLVIRMHRTTEYMSKRAIKLLRANNVNILGCVLAGRYEEMGAYGYYVRHYYRYYQGGGGRK